MMSKPGLVAMAAPLVPRRIEIHRGIWPALAAAMMGLLVWLIRAAVSSFGWLWGQAQVLTETAPEAARAVLVQVEQTAPARDASGTDIGPVARYPGLASANPDGLWLRPRAPGRA